MLRIWPGRTEVRPRDFHQLDIDHVRGTTATALIHGVLAHVRCATLAAREPTSRAAEREHLNRCTPHIRVFILQARAHQGDHGRDD